MLSSNLRKSLLLTGAVLAIAAPSCNTLAPDTGGTFSACYKDAGGDVRFVNQGEACAQGEKLATWNQSGPQGPAGAAGAAGAAGVDGVGPLYHKAIGGTAPLSFAQTTVISMNVPAGDYMIDFLASTNRPVTATLSIYAYCFFPGATSIGERVAAGQTHAYAPATVALHAPRHHPGGAISIICQATPEPGATGSINLLGLDLTATKVSSITELP